jgi:hypothetical protein
LICGLEVCFFAISGFPFQTVFGSSETVQLYQRAMLCMAIGYNPLNARGGGGSFRKHIPPLHYMIKRFHAASSRSGLNKCASRPQCDFNRVKNSGSLSARAIKRANPRASPVEKYPG